MPKFQTRTLEIEDKIINMYGLGLTTRDIQAHLRDIYGADISADLVSNITDTILPFIAEWQGRVLESFYPIIYLDAIHFKVRENAKVESRGTYFVVGIDATGHKDVLGFYIGDAESASFWQQVCNNLASRGVQDVCIACIDGLAGFATAIRNIFPSVIIQRCVIHQIRYSMQYVSSKDSKEFMTDLKSIYRATTLEIAEEHLDRLESKWGKTYPISVRSWRNNWSDLSTYFQYSPELRKIIYTTNTIEGFNRQIRKATKTRQMFKTKTSLEKVLYLATKNITKKWDMPVANWGKILGQLEAFFPGKIEKYVQ
jgi:transposase-like protein